MIPAAMARPRSLPAGLNHPDTRCELRVQDVGLVGLLAEADYDRAHERTVALLQSSYPIHREGRVFVSSLTN